MTAKKHRRVVRRGRRPLPSYGSAAEQKVAVNGILSASESQLAGRYQQAVPKALEIGVGPEGKRKVWIFVASWANKNGTGTIPIDIGGARLLIPAGSTKADAVNALDNLRDAVRLYWGAINMNPFIASCIVHDVRMQAAKESRFIHRAITDENPASWPRDRNEKAQSAAEAVGLLALCKLDKDARHELLRTWVADPMLRADAITLVDVLRRQMDGPVEGGAE